MAGCIAVQTRRGRLHQPYCRESELVGEGKGRIRFFPDGSSTGGRIDLELLGDRAAVNVRWSNGLVTVER
jgi:general secretion pathway protein H